MSKFQNLLRSAVLAAIVIGAEVLCGLRLLEIQIADGSKYLAMTQSTHTATQDIEAARGKIADSTGKILNPIPVKEALNIMGFKAGECRLPLCSMSDEQIAKLRSAMEPLGLVGAIK